MRLRPLLRRGSELWQQSGELAGLAPNRLWRACMRLAVVSLPLKARVPPIRTTPVPLRIRGARAGRRIYLSERVDFTVLQDVFLRGEYDVALPEPPKAIIDLGAHIGVSTLYFHQRFPDARILAVEPNPANFQRLRANVRGLQRVRLVEAAVGAHPGTAWLDVAEESWRTMIVADPAGRSTVQVPVKTIDELLGEAGFARSETLLKIDVEGAEWDALSNAMNLGDYLGVVGDLHRDLLPVSAERFFGLFNGLRVEGHDSASSFSAVRPL